MKFIVLTLVASYIQINTLFNKKNNWNTNNKVPKREVHVDEHSKFFLRANTVYVSAHVVFKNEGTQCFAGHC